MYFTQLKKEVDNHQQVVLLGFSILSCSLFFSFSIIRLALVVFLIASLYAVIKDQEFLNLRARLSFRLLLLPAYFICSFLSLIHPSPNFYWLERGWMLLVLPALIGLLQINEVKIKKSFFKGFILGAISGSIINLVIATFRSIRVRDGAIVFDSSAWGGVPFWFSIDHFGNFFFSEYFSFFMHPSYASLSITLALALTICTNPFEWSKRKQAIVVIFLLLVLALLSSRAGIAGALATMVVLIIFDKSSLTKSIRYLLLASFALSVILFSFNPRVKNLFASEALIDYSNPRIVCLISSIKVIEKNWLWGVGLDRVEEHLNEEYRAENYVDHYTNSYNAHNQFLETWMGLGVLGLVLLLAILVVGFRASWKSENLFPILFLVNTVIHFSFESMLFRVYGILVFTLFYSILFLSRKKDNSGHPESQ